MGLPRRYLSPLALIACSVIVMGAGGRVGTGGGHGTRLFHGLKDAGLEKVQPDQLRRREARPRRPS